MAVSLQLKDQVGRTYIIGTLIKLSCDKKVMIIEYQDIDETKIVKYNMKDIVNFRVF